jgi:hypothetical protein
LTGIDTGSRVERVLPRGFNDRLRFNARLIERAHSQGKKMTAESDNQSSTLTHAASWALERLARQRYGRDAPALNWSVAQELRNAGYVSVPANGRGAVSITEAGQNYLRARAVR